MYWVKDNIIKNLIPDPEVDPDTPFIMVLIKEAKGGRLVFQKVSDGIASMLLDKFFDCLSNIKKNAVW